MPRGDNPKSRANIEKHKIKKGEVRNPEGINKKRPLTDEYFLDLESPLPEKECKRLGLPAGTTFAKGQARQRNLDALQPGGYLSSKEMREAIEGRAPERLEITGTTKVETTIRLVDDRTKT